MYVPSFNAEQRTGVLQAMMRAHPLATVVTLHPAGLFASHLPLILEEDGTDFGVLRGHLARANTQWRDPDPAVDALAIFAGPSHYVSPSWYPSKAENGRSVPTWNYIVVHASGPFHVIDDPDWLRAHLPRLTARHEAESTPPWTMDDAPADYIAAMIRGIVGIEIPIRRLEGKWKLSQNRSPDDREGVIQGLDARHTPAAAELSDLMRKA